MIMLKIRLKYNKLNHFSQIMLQFLLSNPSFLHETPKSLADFPPSKFGSTENFHTNRKSCGFLGFFFFVFLLNERNDVSSCLAALQIAALTCYLVILCGLSESSFFFFISFPFTLLISVKTRKEMQQDFSVSFVSAKKTKWRFQFLS